LEFQEQHVSRIEEQLHVIWGWGVVLRGRSPIANMFLNNLEPRSSSGVQGLHGESSKPSGVQGLHGESGSIAAAGASADLAASAHELALLLPPLVLRSCCRPGWAC